MSYFNLYDNDIRITLQTYEQHRGNVFYEKIKHCFEYKIIVKKTGNQEIGFSNSNKSKKFICYFANRPGNQILRYENSTEELHPCSMKLEENKWYEVCYDSENSLFQVFKDDEYCKATVSLTPESYWYIYVDQGKSSGDVITINAGYSKFKNRIPKGYSSWIPINIAQTCLIKKNYIFIMHLYTILL